MEEIKFSMYDIILKSMDKKYENRCGHLYEILDSTYDYMYDGGCCDISFFK